MFLKRTKTHTKSNTCVSTTNLLLICHRVVYFIDQKFKVMPPLGRMLKYIRGDKHLSKQAQQHSGSWFAGEHQARKAPKKCSRHHRERPECRAPRGPWRTQTRGRRGRCQNKRSDVRNGVSSRRASARLAPSLASSTLFQSHLWRGRSHPSAPPGSSAGSRPAGGRPRRRITKSLRTQSGWTVRKFSITIENYSGALILNSCTNVCVGSTHGAGVVFRNSLVHIGAIGPVDHDSRGGVTGNNKKVWVRYAGGSENGRHDTGSLDLWIISLLPEYFSFFFFPSLQNLCRLLSTTTITTLLCEKIHCGHGFPLLRSHLHWFEYVSY